MHILDHSAKWVCCGT